MQQWISGVQSQPGLWSKFQDRSTQRNPAVKRQERRENDRGREEGREGKKRKGRKEYCKKS